MCEFRELAREDLERIFDLVQVDRPGVARVVALKLRFLASDALLAGNRIASEHATQAAVAADAWYDGSDTDDARVRVFRAVLELARELELARR